LRVDAPPHRYEPDASLGSSSEKSGARNVALAVGRLQFAKDREICDYARKHAYVLLTNDLDFPRILAHTRQAAPSVVLSVVNHSYQKLAVLRFSEPFKDCEAELNYGAIVTLDWSDKPRARVLPLR
jgi:predicted nuclease of predicted toxin-antitoxin system